MPAPYTAAVQLLGDPNQAVANETEEERRKRLAQLAGARDRMSSALGGGMAGAGLKVSPAAAALLGGAGL